MSLLDGDEPSRPQPGKDLNATDASDEVEEFFLRNGFDVGSKAVCDNFAQERFPSASIELSPSQGYCSYTLTIGSTHILQFRPDTFSIDQKIVQEGRKVLGHLVPRIKGLGFVRGIKKDDDAAGSDKLYVYLLDMIPGVTLEELHETYCTDEPRLLLIKRRLLGDLGAVFAKTYLMGKVRGHMDGHQFQEGRVGSSIPWRLGLLENIASDEARAVVDQVQGVLGEINTLPWCLTHGDLVPANIMMDPSTGRLCGLIDWAEGEYLPFGVGLYGLEEVLGHAHQGVFKYHPYHECLRQEFWESFHRTLNRQGIPSHKLNKETISVARQLGILLWRGIAFENGRLDRVVEAGTEMDDLELQKLHLFLETTRDGISFESAGSPILGHLRALNWLKPQGVWRLMKGVYMFVARKFRALYHVASGTFIEA